MEHGESYDEAFTKEVGEELEWNTNELILRIVGEFGPKDGLNTISTVYEIISDIEPKLNLEDFVSAEWLTPENLARKIAEGHPAKSNIMPLLRIVYSIGV